MPASLVCLRVSQTCHFHAFETIGVIEEGVQISAVLPAPILASVKSDLWRQAQGLEGGRKRAGRMVVVGETGHNIVQWFPNYFTW